MPEPVVYRSRVRVEPVKGPLRRAHLPAEEEPVLFGVQDTAVFWLCGRRNRSVYLVPRKSPVEVRRAVARRVPGFFDGVIVVYMHFQCT